MILQQRLMPNNFADILNRMIMPEESVLPVETKEISIIPPEHEQIIKEIAKEPSQIKMNAICIDLDLPLSSF